MATTKVSLQDFLSMFSGGKGYVNGKEIKKIYFGKENFTPRNMPEGYTQVEYIQSSGTQYIDTGFAHNQDTRVVMDAQVVTQPSVHAWLFEGRVSYSSCCKGLLLLNGTTWNSDYNDSTSRYAFSSLGVLDRLSIDYNKNSLTINGYTQTWTATTFQSTANLTLLACNTAGTVAGHTSAKLYSCQIYDNDTLVRDYVPCVSKSGEVGLFDMVNSAFYQNSGTGTFTAGASECTGVAKKIKRIYTSDESGTAQLFFSGGVDVSAMGISYSGKMVDHNVVTMGNGKQYRLLELTSSGTLTLEGEVNADVWVCHGGKKGANGTYVSGATYPYQGGKGGDGGSFCNISTALPEKLVITIAAAAGSTSINGVTLSSWVNGAKGGTGGKCVDYRGEAGVGGAKAGGDTRPFQDSYFTKYPCAGGGGGEAWEDNYGSAKGAGCGGSSFGAGGVSNPSANMPVGGETGGGTGAGYVNRQSGATAGTYYGSGGGGGAYHYIDYDNSNGKSGYQGACFIRIPLEQSA